MKTTNTLRFMIAASVLCLASGLQAQDIVITNARILDGNGEVPKSVYPILKHVGYEAGQKKLDRPPCTTRRRSRSIVTTGESRSGARGSRTTSWTLSTRNATSSTR